MLDDDIRNLIIRILFGANPTDDEKIQVRWENENVARPEIPRIPGANDFYVNLDIISDIGLGQTHRNITGPDDSEIVNIRQTSEVDVDVSVTGFEAELKIIKIRDDLNLPTIQDFIKTLGITVIRKDGVTNTSFEEDERFTQRRQFDIVFSYTNTVSESTSIIETVTQPVVTVT